MARIFLSFFDGIIDINNPNAISCHYEMILNGFKESGNEVLYFNHKIWGQDFGNPPKQFIDELKKFNPELIILYDNRCYKNLYKFFDCPIIIWEADSYLYFSNKEDIKKNPNRYFYVIGQTVLKEKIKEYFGIKSSRVFYLPSATSIKAEKIKQDTNISFIGTKFYAPDIVSEFMSKKPSFKEILTFQKIMLYVEKNPFSTTEEVLKEFKVISKNISNIFDTKSVIDFVSAKNRIQTLAAISDLGLKIYGTDNWTKNLPYEPEICLSFQNKPIYTIKQNQDIYNSSKISLNINHAQAQSGFSWRVYDIMASNSCLVTQEKSDLKYLFPKINIPTYRNKHEAYEICKKILNEKNLRKDIVYSCQEIINKKYRFQHRMKEIEDIFKVKVICKENKGKITRLEVQTSNFIFNKKNNIVIQAQKARLNIRIKLIWYSILMVINQIPIINKLLISRDSITESILKTIKEEQQNNKENNIKKHKPKISSFFFGKLKIIIYSSFLIVKQIPIIGKLIIEQKNIVNKINKLTRK